MLLKFQCSCIPGGLYGEKVSVLAKPWEPTDLLACEKVDILKEKTDNKKENFKYKGTHMSHWINLVEKTF